VTGVCLKSLVVPTSMLRASKATLDIVRCVPIFEGLISNQAKIKHCDSAFEEVTGLNADASKPDIHTQSFPILLFLHSTITCMFKT
jgi:hypothetical protein